MRLFSFDGLVLPTTQAETDAPVEAVYDELPVTGSTSGAYALYGDTLPFPTQDYSYDFWFNCGDQVAIDAFRGKIGKRGILRKLEWDKSLRETIASFNVAKNGTSLEDVIGRVTRYSAEFKAEPLWYGIANRQVNFTTVSSVNLNTPALYNIGNFRCIKWLILTLTTSITATVGNPFRVTITPTTGTTTTFDVIANLTQPIVIDCGQATVLANSANAYRYTSRPSTQIEFLHLDPGPAVLSFQRVGVGAVNMSGNIVFRDTWK